MDTPTEHWLSERLHQVEAGEITPTPPPALLDRVLRARARRRAGRVLLLSGVALLVILVAAPPVRHGVASWFTQAPAPADRPTTTADPEVQRQAVLRIQGTDDPALVALDMKPEQIVVARHGVLSSATEAAITAARGQGVVVTVRDVPWSRAELLDLVARIRADGALREEFSILGADLLPDGVQVTVGQGQSGRGRELAARLHTSIPLVLTDTGSVPAQAPPSP